MLYVHANRTDCYYIRDRVLHWFSPLSLCLMANIFFAFIFRFVPCCELSCFAFLVFVPFCMLNWQEQSLQFWFRSFLYAELARTVFAVLVRSFLYAELARTVFAVLVRSFLYAKLARSLCSFISSCVLLQVGVRFCRAALIHILELASVQAPRPGLKVYRFDRGAVTYKQCQLSVTASFSPHFLPVSLTFSLCTPIPGSLTLLQTHGYFVFPS